MAAETTGSAAPLFAPIAVLDACVLYPASLRDLFVTLAVNGLYLPKWTDEIHEEWIENLLEHDRKQNDPLRLERSRLERVRDLMERACPRTLVTDYAPLVSDLDLPDADDRHVLAAAIASSATVVVTFNLRDYPATTLAAYGVEAVHPDIFLCSLFDHSPDTFRGAIGQILDRLKNPPRTWAEHVAVLRDSGLRRLAERLT